MHMKTPSQVNYYVSQDTTPSIRPAMATRMTTEPRGQEGFEFKGILLLAVCGFYALLLFVVAKILSFMFSKITAPVKSVFFSVSAKEVRSQRKQSVEINNNTKVELLKAPRVHNRSLCHG